MDEELRIVIPSSANKELADPSLLNFYQDLEERVYWIDSEIAEADLELIHYILKWNKEDKGKAIKDRKPIKLFISSPGGMLEIAETLISFIKMSKTPIYAIGLGMVASAASLIYLSCHKKFATESTFFILHKGSCSGLNGNYDEIEAFMADYKERVSRMIEFYIENTGYTEEEINANINSDWYVRFPEALEKGLVDEKIEDIDFLT